MNHVNILGNYKTNFKTPIPINKSKPYRQEIVQVVLNTVTLSYTSLVKHTLLTKIIPEIKYETVSSILIIGTRVSIPILKLLYVYCGVWFFFKSNYTGIIENKNFFFLVKEIQI